MRALALALAGATLLAACEREPTFEERYAKTRSQIHAKDAAIEKELRAREAVDPVPAATVPPPSSPAG